MLTSARCMAPDDGAGGAASVVADPAPPAAAPDPATPPPAAEPTDPTATPDPAAAPEPDPAPKPDKVERRIANLTRKMADEARAREAAERRAEAAEALLNAGKTDAPAAREAATDIEARAAALVAEREFNRRLTEIDAAGKKEFGLGWEDHKATLTGLGATGNQAFLQALAEAENPAKLFAHFADDTDALMDLLAKPSVAMAAKIGRLDAQLSKPEPPRPLSNAPKPVTPITTPAVVKEPDINDPNLSMKEYAALRAKNAPRSLGGRGGR